MQLNLEARLRARARIAARLMAVVATAVLWLVAGPAAHALPQVQTAAKHAILIDYDTGTVLLDKAADEPMPPASMSKLMTLYLVFERLKDGSLALDDTLPVSRKAWRKGGSKMFVEAGKRVRVEDLIQGVIVDSGNDACVVLAEGLAGSEDYFAQVMTERAGDLGLKNSHFVNATGWPDPGQYMSVRDLALLSQRIIRDFPDFYHYFSERSFTFGVDVTTGKPITQPNRNVLLFRDIGVDGLKTGHTQEAGYGMVISAERNGRRLILVIAGLSSERQRANEAERLLEFGFRNFGNYKLFSAGEVVDTATVWLGDRDSMPLIVSNDVHLTLSRRARRGMKVTLSRDEPIPAPISAGQQLAKVVITTPETEPITIPLLAQVSVNRLGPLGRIKAAFGYLLWGAPGTGR